MNILPSQLPRSACRKPMAKRPDVRRRNQQVALFCHLGRLLWRLARQIPWSRLTEQERKTVVDVADRIADAADTAKAASERG